MRLMYVFDYMVPGDGYVVRLPAFAARIVCVLAAKRGHTFDYWATPNGA